jgi:hypothetical protein
MKANARRQFEAADRAVMRAVERIESAVVDLFATTRPLEHVANQYVVERLAAMLLKRNPDAFDAFKHFKGKTAGVVMVAVIVDVAALLGWLRRWKS